MSEFGLDPRLEADTEFVVEWSLSRVLLMNDSRYPWLILVPRCSAMEIHDLDAGERSQLMVEIARATSRLKKFTGADKMNVGSLGNIVAQLHVHVVARRRGDPGWPGPVWGYQTAIPYGKMQLLEMVDSLAEVLA